MIVLYVLKECPYCQNALAVLSENKINVLRVPIGDWMYIPYGPFSLTEENQDIKCTDGAIEALDNLFVLGEKYNMKILIDLSYLRFNLTYNFKLNNF
jgi:glutaredoxin